MPAALNQPPSPPASPPSKKFTTLTGGFTPFGSTKNGGSASPSNRSSVKNLFGVEAASPNVPLINLSSDAPETRPTHTKPIVQASTLDPRARPLGTPRHEEGPWSVSVAEASPQTGPEQTSQLSTLSRMNRRTNRKKHGKTDAAAAAAAAATAAAAAQQSFILYVTTPTHNLTLHRSASEIIELHQKLRETINAHIVLPEPPTLNKTPYATQTSSRRILKTISRTLSPGASRGRVALSQITGSLASQSAAADTSPASTAPAKSPAPSSNSPSPATSATPLEAPALPSGGQTASGTRSESGKTTGALANYFTALSNHTSVTGHKAWKRFIRVGTEDLQSVRVERRVHRVRSDLASHVKSSVAPTNTNVGAGPSQSDIGDDGGRTEDERDAGSISGRSASRQSWNNSSNHLSVRPGSSRSSTDRPDSVNRPISNDASMTAPTDASSGPKKSSPNFANIPEESDKEREASTSFSAMGKIGAQAAMGSPRSPSHPPSSSSIRDAHTSVADTSADSAAILSPTKSKEHRRRRRAHREPEKVTVDDFEMIRVLGKGCAGKVLLVRHKPTQGLFAMKSIHKRHVLAHQELQHTLTEQAVLKRMAREVTDPFVVKLWWSFHDKSNLYLVMDFHPGGDLATQLSRWGRLGRDRARFYAAEIVEGVEGLHKAGVIYRDLKPENVLIGADGHIVLSDFGLSKEFPDRAGAFGNSTPPPNGARSSSSRDVARLNGRSPHWMSASEDSGTMSASESGTNASPRRRAPWGDERDTTTTFCGTAEYLAPEVIQGSAYSYEVDWWSFGTMLYEMLVGITPFWADTHSDMYVRVLHDELAFPDDRVLDTDTKSILRGLLQRNPMLRMKEPRIKRHPYFSMIEWAHVFHKRYIPPYIPPIDPSNETDTQNFDEAFLDMQPVVHGDEDEDNTPPAAEKSDKAFEGADVATEGLQLGGQKDGTAVAGEADGKGATVAARAVAADGKSLFDGYSFRGRKDSGSIRSVAYSDSISIGAASHAETESVAPSQTTAITSASPVVDLGPAQMQPIVETSKPTTPVIGARTSSANLLASAAVAPTPAVTPAAPLAPALPAPAPLAVQDNDSEDDDSAARDALMALAVLEQEASAESSMLSQGSTATSTQPTSVSTDTHSDDAIWQSKTKSGRVKSSSVARSSAAHEAIVETEDEGDVEGGDEADDASEDDDWDLIDATSGGQARPSEMNGSRGQNLFARGVVDTYRLLRRQDSTRLTPSTSANSSSGRPFGRLRQKRAAAAAGALHRPSRGDLTSGSAASLESGAGGTGSHSLSSSAHRTSGKAAGATPMTNALGEVAEDDVQASGNELDKPSPSTPASAAADTVNQKQTAFVGRSSEDNGSRRTTAVGAVSGAGPSPSKRFNGNSPHGLTPTKPTSSSRIKWRFTTFFEQTTR